MKISGCIKQKMKQFNLFWTCYGIYHWLLLSDLPMVLGAPTGFAADRTRTDQSRYSKSRVTVNTALSETTGGEAEQHGGAAATQEMIQDLKTPPGVIFNF
ncbi:hypothetical protein ILYODFUR_020829, partial [Ilyodon furcidens]